MRFTRLLALLAAVATLACGDDEPSDPGDGADEFTVSVVNNDFTPSALSVPVGSTVIWQWNSSGVAHNVTFEDQTGNSPPSVTTGSHQRTFGLTGDYAYICTIHPGMDGVVSVTTTATGGTGNEGTGGGGGGTYP